MKQRIFEFVAGLLFGMGLLLSGMTDPSKVLGFLDVAGVWDPSLAFVMGGAVLVGLLAFAVAKRRSRSLLGAAMQLPTSRALDRRLVLGSLVFGVGWGMAGFCPGPALVSAATGQPKAVLFVLAMLAGMAVFEVLERMRNNTGLQPKTGAH
ncbi:YeeE/YedE family protein [Acidovorax sp. DW039]|uniref:YeeE/YedE family protein n=1 Tax=Acidovorax sp. DW039 TaxID=3095606 RepID=UPI0030889109|nr:YeeE/YedE family protein [Acidovorax sp. DW039]